MYPPSGLNDASLSQQASVIQQASVAVGEQASPRK